VLKGLGAYVRALSPAACPPAPNEPITAAAALADVRRSARAAVAALDHHDGPAAVAMIAAARSGLGDIDERYRGEALAPQRRALALASADLAAAESDARRDPDAARGALVIWLAKAPSWSDSVAAAAPRSLYAPARLVAVAVKSGR
jgi:hypothetical protein